MDKPYRLLIADDEYSVRANLCGFDWKSVRIELNTVCTNGMEAYQVIQEGQVDIVLTDIRMPVMDGLRLLEEIKKNHPYIYVVMLSGYDDFSYVQTSLRNGAADYLLKPLDHDQMKETFCRVVEMLDRDKQRQIKQQVLERKSRLAAKAMRKNFLGRLLYLPLSDDDIEEGCVYSEISLDTGYYTVCVFAPDKINKPAEQKTGSGEGASQPEACSNRAADTVDEKEWKTCLFGMEKVIEDYCESKEPGYSWINTDTGRMYVLLVQPSLQNDESSLRDFAGCLRDEIYSIAGLLKSTVSCGIGPTMRFAGGICISCRHAEQALEKRNKPDSINFYMQVEGIPGAGCILEKESGKPTQCDGKTAQEAGNHIIGKVTDYITNNYMNLITLESAAGMVYLNPGYLSHLFKAVIGMNFVQYLTMIRIEQAMKLLKDCNYKVYEVGGMVGYENPRYFARVFRKQTGLSPYEYRNA